MKEMQKILLQQDGNQIVATWGNFENLQLSPAGFGDTIEEAVCALIENTPKEEMEIRYKYIKN